MVCSWVASTHTISTLPSLSLTLSLCLSIYSSFSSLSLSHTHKRITLLIHTSNQSHSLQQYHHPLPPHATPLRYSLAMHVRPHHITQYNIHVIPHRQTQHKTTSPLSLHGQPWPFLTVPTATACQLTASHCHNATTITSRLILHIVQVLFINLLDTTAAAVVDTLPVAVEVHASVVLLWWFVAIVPAAKPGFEGEPFNGATAAAVHGAVLPFNRPRRCFLSAREAGLSRSSIEPRSIVQHTLSCTD